VCWKPCSSCWSFYLLWEEFLSAPIHSPLSGSPYRSFKNSSKQRKPPNQSSKNHRELPLHRCKLPLNQCNSLWTNACKPLENRAAATTSTHTGQTAHHHWSDRCPTYEQGQHSDRLDRRPRPVRPVCNRAQKWRETTWKPSKCIQ
jgi:hypothetical protein